MISITLPVFGRTVDVPADQAIINIDGVTFGPGGSTSVQDLVEIVQETSVTILRIYKDIPDEWWDQAPNTTNDDLKDLTAALTMLTILLLALNGRTDDVREVFRKVEETMNRGEE